MQTETRMLMNSLQQVGMYNAFKEVVVGIADILSLFRSSIKGNVDSFTLESLAMKFLKEVRQEKLYNGFYDVQILQSLLYEKIPKDNLLDELSDNSKLFQNLSLLCKKQYQWT